MTAVEPSSASRPDYDSLWERFRRYPAASVVLVYGTMVVGFVIAGFVYEETFRFASDDNLGVLLQQLPRLMIITLGVGVLMISGEFDLSVGGAFVLAPYLMGIMLEENGWPVWAALALGLLSGVVIGTVNGVLTTRFKIPSFIATLGMMFLLRGLIRWVAGAGKGSDAVQQFLYPGETFEAILTGRTFGPIHAQALWLIAFAIVIYVILNRHRFGNHVFAVGGNRDAAIATGINANRVKIIAFIICSVLAATAGIFSATRINATIPRQTLLGLELQAIASCVIGGLFLFGGRGTVLGMVSGAALIATIDNVFALARFPGMYFKFFVGAIIVLAAILNVWVTRRVAR